MNAREDLPTAYEKPVAGVYGVIADLNAIAEQDPSAKGYCVTTIDRLEAALDAVEEPTTEVV